MQPLIDISQVTRLATGLDHPEGLAVLSDGTVVAGGEAGQLYRVAPDGSVDVVATTGGFALGLCVDAADNVFVADIGSHSVWHWAPGGNLREFSSGPADRPFRHPNALALSASGLFVSDSGAWDAGDGTIARIGPDGSGVDVGSHFRHFPNGLAVSPDGRWLYVAESQFGITRATIEADGALGTREEVLPLPGQVPDGLLFDGTGALLVTFYQPNSVYRLTVDGAWELLLHDPLAQSLAMPTNAAWLADGRLGLANLGGWHLAAVPVPFPPTTPAPVPFL